MIQLGKEKAELTMRVEALVKQLETDSTQQVRALISERELWKDKAVELEERLQLVGANETSRANAMLEEELARMRRNFEGAEQERKMEIERLKRELKQREGAENTHQDRVERLKSEKNAEI